MITRRLLAQGGGLTFAAPPDPEPPLPTASVLTASPDGGNSPWTIPSALYHATSNKTFITYVDGAGHIEGFEFNHATGVVAGPYRIHSNFNKDAHASPAIVRRASDGKILIIYAVHNSTPFYMKVANNADSLNGFNVATNLDSQGLNGSRYTDYQMYELDGLLYLFYRDEPTAGTDSRWCISTNDAATPTTGWASQTIVFREPSARSYVITYMDHARLKLHFIATNRGTTVGGITGFSRLGHFYLNIATGNYHKSDGTAITLPLDFSEITTIYSGTANVFASNLSIDDDGLVVVAGRDTIAGDDRYLYIREQADHTWNSTNVASGMDGYIYGGAGVPQAYGWAIDDGDPNLMWAICDVGEQPEVFLFETANGGASFSSTQVTTGGTQLQVQIIPVLNPHHELRVFWHRGVWNSYTSWATGLVGAGTP